MALRVQDRQRSWYEAEEAHLYGLPFSDGDMRTCSRAISLALIEKITATPLFEGVVMAAVERELLGVGHVLAEPPDRVDEPAAARPRPREDEERVRQGVGERAVARQAPTAALAEHPLEDAAAQRLRDLGVVRHDLGQRHHRVDGVRPRRAAVAHLRR